MKRFVKVAYNRVLRPYTPKKIAVFNTVAVRGVRLFDTTDVFPDYEGALVSAIRSQVECGHDVVVVGGGRGVSSVTAARQAGSDGHVRTYEGSEKRYEMVMETVSLNEVADKVDIEHAIVGEAIRLADVPGDAKIVAPSELPSCDVLVLDCEGAEIGILEALDEFPHVLIVETHGFLGSPEEEVRRAVTELGYEVVARDVEIEDRGVYVLTAIADS